MFWIFPQRWVPLYTSVTFSRMRYSHCISNRKWQDDFLDSAIKRFGIISGIAVIAIGSMYFKKHQATSIMNFFLDIPDKIKATTLFARWNWSSRMKKNYLFKKTIIYHFFLITSALINHLFIQWKLKSWRCVVYKSFLIIWQTATSNLYKYHKQVYDYF